MTSLVLRKRNVVQPVVARAIEETIEQVPLAVCEWETNGNLSCGCPECVYPVPKYASLNCKPTYANTHARRKPSADTRR